jgi:ATP-dependent DNA helicase RecG
MALPVNIEDLVHGRTVEWERLEFKEGWNPEAVIHSLCAFANDINNWGGGYIIIGIADNAGQPILPPAGLQQNQLDAIQGEIVKLGNRISPTYFPISQPYILDGKHILVLWCPAGDNRPYRAPETLGKNPPYHEYIRFGSRSIKAVGDYLRQLQELTARIPFDDRINNRATLQDLDLGLIQAHLQEIKSDLYEESKTMSFSDLCRAMLIAKGADEDIRPVNAGLLFFNKEPERFFPRTWIELVWHKDGGYTEHYFKGQLQKQLRDALSYIQTNIISEKVVKHPDRAESNRFFNFPYAAIEEALSNAVYHKSYELDSPIEIQVWPDKIEILSYPAAMPPVNKQEMSTKRRIIARQYRNRRIGDFLKELHLTEGRATGFPTIYDAMEKNGSPAPVFDSDDSTYVLVTIPAHAAFDSSTIEVDNGVSIGANDLLFRDIDDLIDYTNGATNRATTLAHIAMRIILNANGATNRVTNEADTIIAEALHTKVKEMLIAADSWISGEELFKRIGLTNQSFNRKKFLDPILDIGWIGMKYPNNRTHPEQRYKISESGKRLLAIINK